MHICLCSLPTQSIYFDLLILAIDYVFMRCKILLGIFAASFIDCENQFVNFVRSADIALVCSLIFLEGCQDRLRMNSDADGALA